MSDSLTETGRMRLERSLDEVLKIFLREQGYLAERRISQARLLVCSIFMVRALFVSQNRSLELLLSGDPATLFDMTVLLFGVVISAFSLYFVTGQNSHWFSSEWSVTIDSIIVYGALCSWVLFPEAHTYRGFVFMPQVGLNFVVLMASGFRLSAAALRAALACGVTGTLLVAFIDLQYNTDLVTYGEDDVSMFAGGFVASIILAWIYLVRTRNLVLEGSKSLQEAEKVRSRMNRLLDEEVAEKLMATGELRLSGENRSVAILFSDLRGFTQYAEGRMPHVMVQELNGYLDTMVTEIRDVGGSIDKFIGDAIMATFGGTKATGNEATRAIGAARAMQEALLRHNRERAEEGLPPFRQGIGVHYGKAIAGTIGANERMEYTVVGDAVNTASRLESATKEEGVEVLISAQTVQRAQDEQGLLPRLKEAGVLELKGKEEKIAVYTFADPPRE